MPDYRMVKNPGMLKGTVIEAADRGLRGSVDPAIGLGTEPDRPDAQLDIRHRDGNTFVSLAVDTGKGRHVSQEH